MALYLIVYRGLGVIPQSLREYVKTRLTQEYKPFDVELDFSERRPPKDLTITFTAEMPMTPIYGESTRLEMTTGGTTAVGTGDGSVHVRAMQVCRIDPGNGGCETAFPESEDKLGDLMVYVAVHETAHMLGLNTGGFDGSGHSTDPANWMSDPWEPARQDPQLFFDYTVRAGDTLNTVVMRYKQGTLTRCHVGPDDLTASGVWGHPRNKNPGFIADPAKGKTLGRRANDPKSIYLGEMAALFNYNVKATTFRASVPFYTGKKSVTDEQQATIKRFVSDRMAIVK
jgi:hypothetical protein